MTDTVCEQCRKLENTDKQLETGYSHVNVRPCMEVSESQFWILL